MKPARRSMCSTRKTGDVIWERDRDEASTWNTPLVTEYDGKEQVILNGTNRVRSYDLATGELLWECGGQTGNPIPSPMRFEDLAIVRERLPRRSGLRDSARVDRRPDRHRQESPGRTTKGTPYVSCAALVGDRLYFTKDRAAIVSCLNAKTGEPIINQKRLPAIDDMYASPVSAARTRLLHRPQRCNGGHRRHQGRGRSARREQTRRHDRRLTGHRRRRDASSAAKRTCTASRKNSDISLDG